MDRRELRLLVERYFHLGFKNQVILDSLKNRHGIPISLLTLKRRPRDYSLKSRGAQIEDKELREILLREISGPGQLRGYRAVWHSLLFFICVFFLFCLCLTLLGHRNNASSSKKKKEKKRKNRLFIV